MYHAEPLVDSWGKCPQNPPMRPMMPHTRCMNNNTSNNPYVNTLVEMGYDRADCEMVAHAGIDATYPRTIHGRVFETENDYQEATADFLNGM